MLFNPNPFDIFIIKWKFSASRHIHRCSSLFTEKNRKDRKQKWASKLGKHTHGKNASGSFAMCYGSTTSVHHIKNCNGSL